MFHFQLSIVLRTAPSYYSVGRFLNKIKQFWLIKNILLSWMNDQILDCGPLYKGSYKARWEVRLACHYNLPTAA